MTVVYIITSLATIIFLLIAYRDLEKELIEYKKTTADEFCKLINNQGRIVQRNDELLKENCELIMRYKELNNEYQRVKKMVGD